jgi:hypothetical protein
LLGLLLLGSALLLPRLLSLLLLGSALLLLWPLSLPLLGVGLLMRILLQSAVILFVAWMLLARKAWSGDS